MSHETAAWHLSREFLIFPASMPLHRDRYRSFRRHWWLRPGVLLPAAFLLILSVPMVWWISTYDSPMAVAMFVITYVSLLVIVLRMMRQTILEPHIRVNEAAVRQEEGRLEADRRKARADLAATELRLLGRGEITPVLDIWQINPELRQRHMFIAQTVTCRVDPDARELQVRVHLSDDWTLAPEARQGQRLARELAHYLKLLSVDGHARLLRPYAATVSVVVHAHRADGGMTGAWEPVMSVLTPWNDLQRTAPDLRPPYIPGELRFADGARVEPHREIPPGAGTATK